MSETAKDLAKEAAQSIIQDIIMKLIADQIMKRLIAMLPFLGLSFINPIVAFLLSKVLGMVADELIKHISYLGIDARNRKEAAEYTKAKEELIAAIEAGERDAIEQARQKAEKEAADLFFGRRAA